MGFCGCALFAVGSEVSYVELYEDRNGKSTGSAYVLLLLLSDI